MKQQQLSVEELRQQLKEAEAQEKKEQNARKKAYETKRNSYVETIVKVFEELAPKLKELKGSALQEGNLLNKEMYEVYGKEVKNHKSITLKNTTDTMKVEITHQDKFSFDETAQVHIDTIKDVLEKKFAKVNKTMYKALTVLLQRNKQGDWNASNVLKLRQVAEEINDVTLTDAVKQLLLSAQFSGTSDYVRAYKRNKEGKYESIVIQFSTL